MVERDPDCREHGLPAGHAGEPHLRRHARDGEDDRAVERRLYLSASPDRVRVQAAGLGWPIRACPPREPMSQR